MSTCNGRCRPPKCSSFFPKTGCSSLLHFLTISIEGTYYRLPVTYVNANVVGGFNYVLAFHFYLK